MTPVMAGPPKTKAHVVANLGLAVFSCLVAVALVEVALRLFHPKYEHLAEAPYVHDPILGFTREPNHRGSILHPDTGERHPFRHNNLGSRQHRDFSAADLEFAVNIGFFGDSFTENVGMEAQFSFTEPLDYLLNLNAGEETDAASTREHEGRNFNVLNFGVWGYGMQQSLLRYETWESRSALDHVFYVYYENDLWEDQGQGLFHLDDAGQLRRTDAHPNPFALLGKLHVSYLALDWAWRLSAHLGTRRFDNERRLFEDGWWMNPNRGVLGDFARASRQAAPAPWPLFRQLLRRFKAVVEGDGASFQLVRLPEVFFADGFGVATIVAEEGVEMVDLEHCFAQRNPAHGHTPKMASPYRFRRDGHWNEAGNRLAALCLHQYLTPRLGLRRFSEAEEAAALNRYYAAFETPASGAPTDPAAAAIRARYDALRGEASVQPPSLPVPWTPSPDKLVIRSHFDVYLHDGWLAYMRNDCRPSDSRTHFFLHVVPLDLRDLGAERLPSGFDNLGFDWHSAGWLDDPRVWVGFDNFQWQPDHHFFQMTPGAGLDGQSGAATCTAYRKLPRYAIERIRTGQYVEHGEDVYQHLWEGEHVFPAARLPNRSLP